MTSRHLRFPRVFIFISALFGTQLANATIVQFQTVMGDFEVNLYDEDTPKTVANFLAYVESEAYNDTFIHRSVPNFIVQGGGYSYDFDEQEPVEIDKDSPVTNEPKFSNRRGTIAMAKVGSNPNSATNQWFFNLRNNHANLDVQNGGFTVFGEVMGDGMDVINAMAALPRFAFSGAFTDLPLRNYGDDEVEEEVPVTDEHLILITGIVVLDASPDTAEDLNPVPNTLINETPPPSGGSGGGGGNAGWLSLLLLAFLGLGLRAKKR